MRWWKRRKISKEQFFCAGLFSLIWSAVKGGHYVTCSAHTWPTVWLPNTQGGVVELVVVRCCGKGGRQTDKRKEIGPWKPVVDGREKKNITAHIGVGSFSLLWVLSRAAVMWALTSCIMRDENAPQWWFKHLSSVQCPNPMLQCTSFLSVVKRGNLNNYMVSL